MCGYTSGHDLLFHVSAWVEVDHQWQEGVVLPQWSGSSNFGLGSPRFIFYPPLAFLLGGFVSWLLPLQTSVGAYCWLVLLIAGVSMFAFSSDFLPLPFALVAAVMYLASPYFIVVLHPRGALAELLAEALFPLYWHFVVRATRGSTSGIWWSAIVMTAIWLSNIPAGCIVAYSTLLFSIVFAWKTHSLAGSCRIIVGLLFSTGLVMAYIYPALREASLIHSSTILHDPSKSLVFGSIAAGRFTNSVGGIALLQLLWALASVRDSSKNTAPLNAPVRLGIIILALAWFVMMSPISAPLWRVLPGGGYIQYPWRSSFIVAFAFAFLVADALRSSQQHTALLGALAIAMVIASGLAVVAYHYHIAPTIGSLAQVEKDVEGEGFLGPPEYVPQNARWPEHPKEVTQSGRILGSSDTQPPEIQVLTWKNTRKEFEVDSAQPQFLSLRLFAYPRWHAYVNGRNVRTGSGPSGLLTLPVPVGRNHIEVLFESTPDRATGARLSAAALVLLAIFCYTEHRLRTGNSKLHAAVATTVVHHS
jgi:hypothetical protein